MLETSFSTTLAASITAAATSFKFATAPTVTAATVKIDTGDNAEWIYFSSVSTVTATIGARGLSKTEGTRTEVTANKKPHVAGVPIIIVAHHTDLIDKDGDTTLQGTIGWSNPLVSGLRLNSLTTAERNAITANNGAMIYNETTGQVNWYESDSWVTNQSGGSVANASDTVAGKVEMGTDAEVLAGTATGSTGARLVVPADDALSKESSIFFNATDITGAQAETLTDGSSADALHTHNGILLALGGDSTDGALVVTTGTTNINCSQIYQYSSISISGGATLSTTDTSGLMYLKCTGIATITGTINLAGGDGGDGTAGSSPPSLGGAGGVALGGASGVTGGTGGDGSAGLTGVSGTNAYGTIDGATYNGGPGGGGSASNGRGGGGGGGGGMNAAGTAGHVGDGGGGGTGGTAGAIISAYNRIQEFSHFQNTMPITTGSSGGSGGGGGDPGGPGAEKGGGGGGSGASGGAIILMVKGNIVGTSGTITTAGGAGGAGGNEGSGANSGGGGGGGGGSGGAIYLLYGGTYAAPTLTVTAGTGGAGGTAPVGYGTAGGAGGAGSVGYSIVQKYDTIT